jgi:hypothetical protein
MVAKLFYAEERTDRQADMTNLTVAFRKLHEKLLKSEEITAVLSADRVIFQLSNNYSMTVKSEFICLRTV